MPIEEGKLSLLYFYGRRLSRGPLEMQSGTVWPFPAPNNRCLPARSSNTRFRPRFLLPRTAFSTEQRLPQTARDILFPETSPCSASSECALDSASPTGPDRC